MGALMPKFSSSIDCDLGRYVDGYVAKIAATREGESFELIQILKLPQSSDQLLFSFHSFITTMGISEYESYDRGYGFVLSFPVIEVEILVDSVGIQILCKDRPVGEEFMTSLCKCIKL